MEKVVKSSFAMGGVNRDSNVQDMHISQLIAKPNAIGSPNELEPVLAEISHINDLGTSTWYEVVYYFQEWRSYSGSKTFEDGEQVVKWKYCKDCL
jgi:hypothetical protein